MSTTPDRDHIVVLDPVTRRSFLVGLASAAALAAAGGCRATDTRATPPTSAHDHHPAPTTAVPATTTPKAAASDGVLVMVTLYGGNDGLDTVIPAEEGAYRSARGSLARSPGEILDIGEGLGLHPALRRLHARWGEGSLAIVRGVGFDGLDRSHFHCMDTWQAGSSRDTSTGWLGRWLDRQGDDPLTALAIGTEVPLLFRGARRSASLVPVNGTALPGGPALRNAVSALHRPDATRSPLEAIAARAAADMLAVDGRVARLGAGAEASDPVDGGGAAKAGGGGTAGDGRYTGGLGAQLRLVADMIAGGLPTRAYGVSMGGFDTHAAERGAHDRLMAELDRAVGVFLDAVGDRPVTLVAYSEFGRRLATNAAGGTDHGAAGPVLVCGPRVRGGFLGDEPSLTDLVDGDLRANVEVNALHAGLLDGVLGAEPRDILDTGARRDALTLVR